MEWQTGRWKEGCVQIKKQNELQLWPGYFLQKYRVVADDINMADQGYDFLLTPDDPESLGLVADCYPDIADARGYC